MLKLCHSLKTSKRLRIAWQLSTSIQPVRSFSKGVWPKFETSSNDLNTADQKLIDQYLESILFSRKSPSDKALEQSEVSEESEKKDIETKKKDDDDKDDKNDDKKDKDDEDDDESDDDHDHKGSILIPLLNLLKI